MKRIGVVAAVVALGLGLLVGSFGVRTKAGGGTPELGAAAGGIHKIKHVVVIMQENRRSTPTSARSRRRRDPVRRRGVCVPDPRGGCVRPFHDPPTELRRTARATQRDRATSTAARWTASSRRRRRAARSAAATRNDPFCVARGDGTDVMGYHDCREIPNYWTYARDFVLQDHMFEPNASWSLPAHLFLVSEWSAKCSVARRPDRAARARPNRPAEPPDFKGDLKHTIPTTRGPTSRISCTGTA